MTKPELEASIATRYGIKVTGFDVDELRRMQDALERMVQRGQSREGRPLFVTEPCEGEWR